MRLKQIEKEAKRVEILNIARKIFSEKGFDNTSMEEIAKKVKIAKGTIYLYFESKYALFFEILSFARENMIEKSKKMMTRKISNLQKIKEMIKIYIDFTVEYPEYLMIFHSIHHQMNPEDRKKIIETIQTKKIEDGSSLIYSLLEEGVKSGEFNPDLNLSIETFRIFTLLISFGVAFNITSKDPYMASIHGEKINKEEILWNSIDKILSFYPKK